MVLAQHALSRGDLPGAKQALVGLLAIQPTHLQALHTLAVVERRLGHLDVALDLFARILRRNPQDAEVQNNLLNLALTFKNSGRLADARGAALKVLEVASRSAKAWQILGLVQWELQEAELAAKALEEARRLAPSDPRILHALARLNAERGVPGVRELYEQALAREPADPELLLGLSLARVAEGDTRLLDLERLTRERPDWVKGHAALAQLRWQTDTDQDFAGSFVAALRSRPSDLELWVGYLGTLMRAGAYVRALEALPDARARVNAPDLFDRYEAVCASEAGELERAEVLFAGQAGTADRGLAVAHIRHLLRTHRPGQAAEIAERLIRDPRAGTEGWSYLYLAWRVMNDPRQHWLTSGGELVRSFDCSTLLPDLRLLERKLRLCHRSGEAPFDQSARGGTQSDGNLFMRPEAEFVQVRQCLKKCLAEYQDQLPPADPGHPFLRARNSALSFTASYSILLKGGGHHVSHMHPHAWISACLYVSVPESVGSKQGDHAGWLAVGQPPEKLGLALEPEARIRPEPGKLVMFPSFLWHGSLPFPQGERLTVVTDFHSQS